MAKAREIMMRKVTTVQDIASVQEASRALVKNNVSGVPVVDRDKSLVGFISERDIIAAAAKPGFLKKRVKDIMTKKVVAVEQSDDIEEISKLFSEKPIRCLPVMDKGRLVGIILRKDVISKLLGYYY